MYVEHVQINGGGKAAHENAREWVSQWVEHIFVKASIVV